MSKSFIIVVAAITAVVLAVGIPNFIKAHQISAANYYVNNLRQLDAAKNQWALEKTRCPMTCRLDGRSYQSIFPVGLQTAALRMAWSLVRRARFIPSDELVSHHHVLLMVKLYIQIEFMPPTIRRNQMPLAL